MTPDSQRKGTLILKGRITKLTQLSWTSRKNYMVLAMKTMIIKNRCSIGENLGMI